MHSNPLTGLPGNREIHTQLAQWVARRRNFVACYLDLNHFKPYNDEYGYARGDQVLLHVAQVITHAVRRPVDFVGHVGGDDFVFLLRSLDWPLRLTAMLEELGSHWATSMRRSTATRADSTESTATAGAAASRCSAYRSVRWRWTEHRRPPPSGFSRACVR